ncbi:ABC transporter permease [Enterococcus sp. LJL120]
MALLFQEMKTTVKSLTYWIVIAVVGFFIFTQLGTDLTAVKAPQPNQEDYGTKITTDTQEIQEQTYGDLLWDYYSDDYTAYPLGFFKSVTPSETEKNQIKEILEKASGKSYQELETELLASLETQDGMTIFKGYAFPLLSGNSYTDFEEDMEQVTKILGEGSDFDQNKYEQTKVPMTYEEALEEYEQIIKDDQVSGAYARIVCDYFGIILALAPVFLAATVVLRDRRSQAQAVIYTKKTATVKLIGLRYISTVMLILIPVLLFSLMPALQSEMIASKLGVASNLFLYYQYILLWLTPTILGVVGLSFLITELFGGIVAIAAQFILWFASISINGQLIGAKGLNLIPRFNTVGKTDIFSKLLPELITNRIFWSVLGIICLFGTILVVDFKRKGGRLFGKKQ